MIDVFLKQSKSVRVQVLLIVSAIANTAIGSFFAYQISHNCGYQFLLPTFTGFILAVICIVLRQIQKGWDIRMLIAFVVLSVGFLGIAIYTVFAIEDETLCGIQYCVANSINSADFISDFQSQYDVTCSIDSDTINQMVTIYAIWQNKYTGINVIYFFDGAWALIFSICFIVTTLVMTVFLGLTLLAKKRQGNLGQPLIP